MDDSSADARSDGTQLQEAIDSALADYRALSTTEVASIVEADTDTVREQLDRMADVGRIERRETTNQDVWLAWKS